MGLPVDNKPCHLGPCPGGGCIALQVNIYTNYPPNSKLNKEQVSVVQPLDSAIHRINHYHYFVFRMAEAGAKRVTGDEPQGTMFQRDVWVRGRSSGKC